MSGKPTLLVLGNRQAEFLAHVARQIPALREHFEIVHGAEASAVPDVSVVWDQVESEAPQPSRTLPVGCQRVKFPLLTLTCLWPFGDAENSGTMTRDGAWPWVDTVADALAPSRTGDDPGDDALYATYMRRSAEAMPDLQDGLVRDATRSRALSAATDIALWDWIEAQFRQAPIFHAPSHPGAALFVSVLGQLVALTEGLSREATARALWEATFLLRGTHGMDFETVPVHPLVAKRFGLSWYDPNADHRWHGHRWTHREYILKYIRRDPFLP